MNSDTPIQIYVNQDALRRSMWWWLAGAGVCWLFAIHGAFIRTTTLDRHIFYGAMFFLMGVACIWTSRRIFKKTKHQEPMLTLTRSGLQSHEGIFKNMGEIPWRDIGVVDLKNVEGVEYFVFSSVNRQPYVDRLSGDDLKKYNKQCSKMGGAALLWVLVTDVHYEKKEFLLLIERILALNKS